MQISLFATSILVGAFSLFCTQSANAQQMTADDFEFISSLPPYQVNANKLVDLLIKGDEAGATELVHPLLAERIGSRALKKLLELELIPYFKDFQKPGRVHTDSRAVMPGQKRGYAFYDAFVDQKGNSRPYIVYMIEDHGKPKCASILLNRTYADMHPSGN